MLYNFLILYCTFMPSHSLTEQKLCVAAFGQRLHYNMAFPWQANARIILSGTSFTYRQRFQIIFADLYDMNLWAH